MNTNISLTLYDIVSYLFPGAAFLLSFSYFSTLAPAFSAKVFSRKAMADQIITADRSRLGRKLGELSNKDLRLVDKALKLQLGLNP